MKRPADELLRGLVAVAIALCLVVEATAQSRKEKDDECSHAQRQTFRERFMPLWFGEVAPDVKWRTCIRKIAPWEPETRVCITKYFDGHAVADYTAATSTSLWNQACQARPENGGPLLLKVEFSNLPEVDRLASSFEHLRLGTNLRDALVVDQPVYELECRMQYGSRLQLMILNSPAGGEVTTWMSRAVATLRRKADHRPGRVARPTASQ